MNIDAKSFPKHFTDVEAKLKEYKRLSEIAHSIYPTISHSDFFDFVDIENGNNDNTLLLYIKDIPTEEYEISLSGRYSVVFRRLVPGQPQLIFERIELATNSHFGISEVFLFKIEHYMIASGIDEFVKRFLYLINGTYVKCHDNSSGTWKSTRFSKEEFAVYLNNYLKSLLFR